MTAKQVYLWYCKEKGIMGNVISMFHAKKPKTWSLSCTTPTYLTFDQYFDIEINRYGMSNVFMGLFSSYEDCYRGNGDTERYIKAKNRWNYFVKNNVKLNTDIKQGDEVEYSYFKDHSDKGKIISFDPMTYRMVIEDVTNGHHSIRPSNIKSINGKPFEFGYIIKRNGKVYGGKKQ